MTVVGTAVVDVDDVVERGARVVAGAVEVDERATVLVVPAPAELVAGCGAAPFSPLPPQAPASKTTETAIAHRGSITDPASRTAATPNGGRSGYRRRADEVRMRFESLAPFRHRPFALFWSGAFVSNIGTWMETVAIGVYVTEVTGRSTWTGLVAAAGFVPTAVLGPVGGALADRVARRRILLTTTLVQTALASLLTTLAVVGRPSPATVTVIVFGNGVASALGFPSYQALLPDLVPAEELPGAIGLSSAQWNLGRVIGPVLAGIVIHLGGFAWALGINAASFLAVVAVLLSLQLPAPAAASPGPLLAAIRDGVAFVRAEPGLRVTLGAMALNTLLAAPFIALLPYMAVEVLDSGAGGTSALVAAQGVGAVLMGLSLGMLTHRLGTRRLLVAMLVLLPPLLVGYGLAPSLGLAVVAIFPVGAVYLGALSTFTTIAQQRAPAHLRGRVLSVNMVMLGALYPLGSVVQGALADQIGLRATTAGAAASMAVALVAIRALRPGVTAALDHAPVVTLPGAVEGAIGG